MTKFNRKWYYSANRRHWLFALFHLWNRCRKYSVSREFYQAWWMDA